MSCIALNQFVLVSLYMVLVVWGQITHPPIIPDFPDPPTFPNVVNMSFVTFIDDPIPIPENIRAEIDCGEVIDRAVMDGGGIANVTWYKNGRPITNNSETNVVIAADNRSMIITDTFRGSPAQVGTEGFYACEVCVVGRNCFTVTRCTDICVPPNLISDSGTVTPTGPVRSIVCGQDLVLDSLQFTILQISCPLFNGTSILCNASQIDGVRVFKDSVEVPQSPTESYRVGPVSVQTEDICGTYTFVLESGCGRDVAVSRVICPGDPPDIDEGLFVPRPDPITPGDKMVKIGTTAYVIDGNDVTIKCNIASGTRPITISWFRNGLEDTSVGSVSTITVSNVNDGDMYMCRAQNRVGFDEETTMIVVQPITVTFSQITYSVDEDHGPAQPVLVLSNPSSTDINVQVRDTESTATNGGVDYDSGIYNVIIPAGETSVPFDVPINDDNIFESNEDFGLTIIPNTLPDGVTRGNPDSATVTIVDNDPITVSFSQTTYSVDEDDGPAQPVLVLSNPSSADITVQVRDTENTATNGGVDYDSGIYNVVIPTGETSVPFDVGINNDIIHEANENFHLTIIRNTLPDGVTHGDPFGATVTIVDDDGTCIVSFDESVNATIVGGGELHLRINVNILQLSDVDVQVLTGVFPPIEMIINANSRASILILNVPNDTMCCDDTILDLNINATSLPDSCVVGNPANARVTIECSNGYSLLDLNCTADCLTSSKTVSAMWRLPAQVTCQHTCQANIACSNGYKETRKEEACSSNNHEWTWKIQPNAKNCTVEVNIISYSVPQTHRETCSFLWTYPDSCVQNITNESHKVFTVDSNYNYTSVENDSKSNDGLIGYICRYHLLEEALRDMDNNTFVNVSASSVTLPSLVSVNNLNNITIYGHDYPTVDCNHIGFFVCKNCYNIVIDNIEWNKCGLLNSSIFESELLNGLGSTGGLHFETCANLTIQFSTFVMSSVQVFQASGTIDIKNVSFSDNYTDSHLPLYHKPNYGGLIVEQYNGAMLKIYIINCLFTNVIPNSTTAQLLIINTAVITSLIINNTRFVNSINGQSTPSIYGKSMAYIDISTEASNATFINVTFQSNNVPDNGNILSVLMNEDDSCIQMYSCRFLNNTASTVALLKTKQITVSNSNFVFNNGQSSLVSSQCQTSLVANFNRLLFSGNTGGPLLSCNSRNMSTSFIESKIQHNTLLSGNGLVALSDYHNLDALLTDVEFVSNDVISAGSVFRCDSKVVHTMSDSSNVSSEVQFHANFTLLNVLFQSNTANSNGDILSLASDGDDSTVQLQFGVFYNNTASNIAVFETRGLTILNSTFELNNGQSNLIISKNHTSLIANLNKLMFSYNRGGPLLLFDCYNISANFDESEIVNNTLKSGHGLVVFQDYYNLDALVASVQLLSNNMSTKGSAFNCTSSVVDPTYETIPIHKLVIQDVEVLGQHGNGHGAGVYMSHQSCDSCLVNGSYTIKQCTFENISNINSVVYYSTSNHSRYSTNLLIENCTFNSNHGTALYLVNSNLIFCKGFTVFENNTAEHGAALYMDLNSRITFDLNSEVLFSKNEAQRYGGAIFCSVSPNSDCYRNISDTLLVLNADNGMIQFSENVASIGGDSVYFNIQQSCDEKFQSISNIAQHALAKQMTTSPKKLQLNSPAQLISYTNMTRLDDIINSTNPAYLIPNIMLGQDISISSCLLDYSEKPATAAQFIISHIENTHQQYSINASRSVAIGCDSLQRIDNLQITGDPSSSHTSNNYYFKVIDRNEPHDYHSDNDFTIIKLRSFYDIAYALKPITVDLIIEISANCHAGFHYSHEDHKCVCYTTDNILSCVDSNATIRRGYWFGTVNKQATVSFCPVNYCNFDRCEATTTFCPLSSSLDDQCSIHRSGTACGNCKNGYTLSFDSVECVDINKCTAGYITLIVTMTILYWILTIVTVFSVMYFKVGIGYFYSLTFYYSVVDILLGQALRTSDALYQMVTIVSSLARLTPQFLGQLCFVKELSGIDQQYIHYIHPLAVLFILLLLSMSARFSPRFSLFVSRGVINVICFLLLLSYTSIASTSLLLTRPLKFTGIDKTYTYLSPDIEYFRGRHLVYGLVAMACGVVIVIGLPVLLLLEPFLNRKINFARIKPLLDQFQGHYKDKYRYFASYYMIGRLVMLVIVNVNINNVFTEAYLQIGVLVIMTLMHIIVRPYAKNILNAIDGFLLLTTIMVAMIQPFEASNGFTTNTVIGLSFFLVLLPLLIFIVVITPYMNKQQIKKFIMFCVSTLKSSKRNETVNRDIELQPASNDVYQVTVDQDLRESVPTTIASVSDQKPHPIKFQESLLELGID